MNRRSFMKILGIAPMVKPKQVSDLISPALADAGVDRVSSPTLPFPFEDDGLWGIPDDPVQKAAAKLALQATGLPDFVKNDFRQQARQHRGNIDVDIAVLRSASPSVKMLWQVQRRVAREEASFWSRLEESPWKTFRKKYFHNSD